MGDVSRSGCFVNIAYRIAAAEATKSSRSREIPAGGNAVERRQLIHRFRDKPPEGNRTPPAAPWRPPALHIGPVPARAKAIRRNERYASGGSHTTASWSAQAGHPRLCRGPQEIDVGGRPAPAMRQIGAGAGERLDCCWASPKGASARRRPINGHYAAGQFASAATTETGSGNARSGKIGVRLSGRRGCGICNRPLPRLCVSAFRPVWFQASPVTCATASNCSVKRETGLSSRWLAPIAATSSRQARTCSGVP